MSPFNRGIITIARSLQSENLRLFNLTVSVSDQGVPPLTAKHPARVSVLVCHSYQAPVIFLESSESTITLRFNLKYLDMKNVAQYGIIAQEYTPDDRKCKCYAVF